MTLHFHRRLPILVASLFAFVSAGLPPRAAMAVEITLQVRPTGPAAEDTFTSIAAARDRIRQQRTRGEWKDATIRVTIAEGVYELPETLTFSPQDGGTAAAPVTYVAAEGATPLITGGRPIRGFKPVEMDGKQFFAASVPEVKAGEWSFQQLFVNGRRQPRTRLPKEGFHTFAGLPTAKPDTPWNEGQAEAAFKPGDLHNWRNLSDVDVIALHFWVESHLPLAQVDEAAGRATFNAKSVFRLTEAHDRSQFARYYVENVFEALETPGQWYLDRPTGTLYYVPRPDESPEALTAIAPRLDQLVRVVGETGRPVEHLQFRGLAFAHTNWALPRDHGGTVQAATNVPAALHFEQATECSLIDCSVAHVSTYAAEFAAGCKNNQVVRCAFTDLGAGGVKIGHDSTATTVTNCDIGPGGHIFHSAVGVWIGHSGDNTVTHNEIHHLYYTGVSVGWSWGYNPSKAVRNRIEFNHIHHIGQGLLSDMGGIYTLGVSPGTVLRYNHIHDVDAFQYGGWGLYNDEGSTGILLENNVVHRTKHGGYHQHYGRENHVTNNIFAFAKVAQIIRSREEEHTSFIFDHNIVYYTDGPLLGTTWRNDRFKLDHNVYWNAAGGKIDFAGASFEEWKNRGHDLHSLIADPLFVDARNGDFTLKAESPALKLGFKPIDMSKIGRQPR